MNKPEDPTGFACLVKGHTSKPGFDCKVCGKSPWQLFIEAEQRIVKSI